MMTVLAYIWQRRWCRIAVSVTIVLGIACLHPFFRQTLVGPKIGGIPWCTWEHELRMQAHPERRSIQDWLYQTLEEFRLIDQHKDGGLNWADPAAVPLYVHLAEDDDAQVRFIALRRLREANDDAAALPVFRRHLTDDELDCRLLAACAVWRASKDRDIKSVLVSFTDANDLPIQVEVLAILGEMKVDAPTLLPRLVTLTQHTDYKISYQAIRALGHFGKPAVPLIRPLLSVYSHGRHAADAAALLGPDGIELLPALIALRSNPDPRLRFSVAKALHKIDPKQFPAP